MRFLLNMDTYLTPRPSLDTIMCHHTNIVHLQLLIVFPFIGFEPHRPLSFTKNMKWVIRSTVARIVALACKPRCRSFDPNRGSFAIWIAWVHDLEHDINRPIFFTLERNLNSLEKSKRKKKTERRREKGKEKEKKTYHKWELYINGVHILDEDGSNYNRLAAVSRQHIAFVPFLALISLLGFLVLFLYNTYILSDK